MGPRQRQIQDRQNHRLRRLRRGRSRQGPSEPQKAGRHQACESQLQRRRVVYFEESAEGDSNPEAPHGDEGERAYS